MGSGPGSMGGVRDKSFDSKVMRNPLLRKVMREHHKPFYIGEA
jgi:hypothetical protein